LSLNAVTTRHRARGALPTCRIVAIPRDGKVEYAVIHDAEGAAVVAAAARRISRTGVNGDATTA